MTGGAGGEAPPPRRVLAVRDATMDAARSALDAEALAEIDPVLADFLRLWDGRRAGRDIPARADFTPEDLRAHLGFINVLEPTPGGSFRYRLVGTGIVAIVGRDVTGLTLDEIYSDRARDHGRMILEMAARDRCPVFADGQLDVPGKRWLGFRLLLVPLAGSDGAVSRFFQRMTFPQMER
ncbi:MAG TPA: PAS domain-containing protein [Azospirillaceae bacterium]|nr:PAS domain-containing protein [Azospirillaceae bacterium]